MIIAFNKPFGVVSQFTSGTSHYATLSEFNFPKRVYPIGRLDADSEGLLLLGDEAGVNTTLLHPRTAHPRHYFAQVEGIPTEHALSRLRRGVALKDVTTLPAQAELCPEPDWIWARVPPIRSRNTIPTSWVSLILTEGKNRQVRRMTAAVGIPTLRLVRYSILTLTLHSIGLTPFLAPGEWVTLPPEIRKRFLQSLSRR